MVRVNVLNDAFKSMYKAKKGGKRQVMTDHPLKLSLSFSWLCKSMVPSVSFSMSTITELEIEGWTARLLLSRQVMCNGCTPAREPIPTNKRHNAAKIFSQPNVIAEESWYDIEQE